MKSSARAVVIGGGVVGASVLYHLAKIGWRDVLLLEKGELTPGSTWHAAGGMHTFNGEANISLLQKYTIDLYREIEAASGQSCGLHPNGGLMLAASPGELDSLKLICSRARYLGMETEMISLEQARNFNPLIDTSHFIGALWRADGGHCDPSGTTHAYVKAARALGASVERFTRVLSLGQRRDGTWDVVTDKGTVHAEHVVNCAGLWAREVGHMVGIELPVLAMEHHYLLTEDLPELAGREKEIVNTTDYSGELYVRQERGGALIGTYEPNGVVWSPMETPEEFSMQLLPEDFERLAPYFEVRFTHFPALGRVGIRTAVNGPFAFAPDGSPLVGPVRGVRNFWVACAVMAGFSQGGGIGLVLSRWMAQGDPGQDIISMDVARFGAFATPKYTSLKVPENYSRRFRLAYPNEELPAARPVRRSPIYDKLRAAGAVMGANFGLEHALWFAPEGVAPTETPTYRASEPPADVSVRSAASTLNGVSIAGPRSRELVQHLVRDDLSASAFRLFQVTETAVGFAPAILTRAGFTGELGYEIWTTPDYFSSLYDDLWDAGRELGLVHFGGRALSSLRLEKAYGSFNKDFRPDYTPGETGLDRFVDFSKPDFTGRAAALAERAAGPKRRFVVMEVADADAEVVGYESIMKDGAAVGYVTSGAYGHCVGRSLAAGYVPATLAREGARVEIDILGEMRAATVRLEPLYDPHGLRLRS